LEPRGFSQVNMYLYGPYASLRVKESGLHEKDRYPDIRISG
jgi:hypothetical protein